MGMLPTVSTVHCCVCYAGGGGNPGSPGLTCYDLMYDIVMHQRPTLLQSAHYESMYDNDDDDRGSVQREKVFVLHVE